MNIRVLLVGFLAVVSGISAIFLVQGLRNPQGESPVERVSVVYAASDIKPGETIMASMLEVRQLRKEEAPEDAIHDVAEAVDRAAQSQLDKGDMLRGKKLAEKGAGRGMAALIRPGMRAFTIQTPSFSSSLAGFLQPGNHVDVLLTTTSSGPNLGGATTLTLLQNAEILAVHTAVSTPSTNKIAPEESKSVTLQVSPEDAQRLDLGQNKGTLHLSLRNLKDKDATSNKPITFAEIQPQATFEVAPPPNRLADRIEGRMRAFTIATPDVSSSLAGFLMPGDSVDVIYTPAPQQTGTIDKIVAGDVSFTHTAGSNEARAKLITNTLVQNVKVLTVHNLIDAPPTNNIGEQQIKSVTLMVTPEEVQRLDASQKSGTLHLSLRRGKDDSLATFADAKAEPPAVVIPLPRELKTRTIRGTVAGIDRLIMIESPQTQTPIQPNPTKVPRPAVNKPLQLVEDDSQQTGNTPSILESTPSGQF